MNDVKSTLDSMIPETMEKKSVTKNSFARMFFVALAILIQVLLMFLMIGLLQQRYTWLASGFRLLAFLLVLGIFSQNKTASVKMPWIVLILFAPIAGSLIYLIVGLNTAPKRMRERYRLIDEYLRTLMPADEAAFQELEQTDLALANMSRYLREHCGCPLFNDSDVEFYSTAEEAIAAQKEALRGAKDFIFMEYHAIEDRESFAEIKEILAQKAADGLDVRIFYDDVGSLAFINTDFIKRMEKLGIQCRVFNPAMPVVNLFLNNRDHRKITVVDGKVGFTGGYNLANEYFNITHPYGQWKDTGVKVTGNAVQTMTGMFLEMWNAIRDTDKDDQNFTRFFPETGHVPSEPGCYIQPYGDSPLDDEQIGENVYLNIISSATRYVWFMTPYLIITDEMTSALVRAAERGVDVRILTPGIPDKRTIYGVTRSYYQRLVRSNVRIYEYTPGFCHAKECISDDRVATCGTINLDFRSLFHHFENGCLMMNFRAILEMKEDYLRTLEVSEEVTEKYRSGQSTLRRAWNHVLRLFSALL